MKKEYVIEIKEILVRRISINANSEEEALLIAEDMYQNSNIILDDSDFECVEFAINK